MKNSEILGVVIAVIGGLLFIFSLLNDIFDWVEITWWLDLILYISGILLFNIGRLYVEK